MDEKKDNKDDERKLPPQKEKPEKKQLFERRYGLWKKKKSAG